MNRLEAMLQPAEAVVWRNKPGMGLGALLLIAVVAAAGLLGLLAWLGGGWNSVWDEPYKLVPIAAVAIVGGYRPADAVMVTDRRLLLTRGLLRRTVVEVALAGISFARVTAAIPYYGHVVTIVCRDEASVHVCRAGVAGAATPDQAEIETIPSADTEVLCDALTDPDQPWGEGARA